MRTDLLLAGGLAALVVGATYAIGREAKRRARDNAVARVAVTLRDWPTATSRATGYVAAGASAAVVEASGAPGWIYVLTEKDGGYAPAEAFTIFRSDSEGMRA